MKQKPQPLDLEEMNKLADEIMEMFCVVDDRPYPEGTGIWGMDTELFSTDENETARSKARKKIITKFKQRLKLSYKFYLRYKDKPELLIKERSEYEKELRKVFGVWDKDYDEIRLIFTKDEYNDWLFKLAFAFKDVFKEEK